MENIDAVGRLVIAKAYLGKSILGERNERYVDSVLIDVFLTKQMCCLEPNLSVCAIMLGSVSVIDIFIRVVSKGNLDWLRTPHSDNSSLMIMRLVFFKLSDDMRLQVW